MKKIAVVALAVITSLSSIVPAQAFPSVQPIVKAQTADVEQVQYRNDRRGHWNGHRGYRERRSGYRRHNDGWWYPLAAFGAGAIIGGAITNQNRPVYRDRQPVYRAVNAHVNWCANRYRSYRAYDNSFQPYNGPRQLCYSPYN